MHSARFLLAATLSIGFVSAQTCDRACLKTTLDQYLNAIGEGIVIPGQAKYASIFNVSGSTVNARARFQYEIF